MTDIVLVHGTTQTAAGFADLVEELARLGHRALTVDVPSGLDATARQHADLLAEQLPDDLDRPVVLAHSATGLLLPALARRVRARHQIWLAAVVGDFVAQRSFLDEIRADPGVVSQPEWAGVDPTTDPVLATYFLFHDADLASLRAALTTVARCDLPAIYAEVPADDPARVPSTYLLPTEDRTLQRSWMASVARTRLGVDPTLVRGGHNCYAAHPAEMATVVDAIGRAA